jgi:hypothetical protein
MIASRVGVAQGKCYIIFVVGLILKGILDGVKEASRSFNTVIASLLVSIMLVYGDHRRSLITTAF